MLSHKPLEPCPPLFPPAISTANYAQKFATLRHSFIKTDSQTPHVHAMFNPYSPPSTFALFASPSAAPADGLRPRLLLKPPFAAGG